MKCGTKQSKKQIEIGQFTRTIITIMRHLKGKGCYALIQTFLEEQGVQASIGTIVKFCKDNIPYAVNERTTYGMGHQVKVGRTSRKSFKCKTNDEEYVKVEDRWMKKYMECFQNVLLEEVASDLVVHHCDGNHFNNERKNLKIMNRSDHARLHATLYWKNKKQQKKESVQ